MELTVPAWNTGRRDAVPYRWRVWADNPYSIARASPVRRRESESPAGL